MGRPLGTLSPARQRQLERLAARIDRHVVDEPLRLSDGDYLGVHLPGMFVGIENDRYTHS